MRKLLFSFFIFIQIHLPLSIFSQNSENDSTLLKFNNDTTISISIGDSIAVSNKITLSQNQFPNHNFETSVVENGKRINKVVDISSPPDAYNLLGMEFHWGPYSFFSDKVSISLIFDNILDKNYRNYLNRLRFYADEIGRNVMLQIKINQ